MDVDGGGGGFDGREAIVVVKGMEQLLVQDAADAGHGVAVEADWRCAVDGVVVGF